MLMTLLLTFQRGKASTTNHKNSLKYLNVLVFPYSLTRVSKRLRFRQKCPPIQRVQKTRKTQEIQLRKLPAKQLLLAQQNKRQAQRRSRVRRRRLQQNNSLCACRTTTHYTSYRLRLSAVMNPNSTKKAKRVLLRRVLPKNSSKRRALAPKTILLARAQRQSRV
jgi:hypothetical protein